MSRVHFKHIERRLGGKRPLFTSASDSVRMGRIRRSGTAPEIAVRQAASSLGLRYRLNNGDLQGSPDLANRTGRWAVFVHGCFWHGHAGCTRSSAPKRNTSFWRAKLRANRDRDERVVRALREVGYRVEVIWECQVADESKLLYVLGRLSRLRGISAPFTRHLPIRPIRRLGIVRIRHPKRTRESSLKHKRHGKHQ